VLNNHIALDGNPGTEITPPWFDSWNLDYAWPLSQIFGGPAECPSVIRCGVVVRGSNATSHHWCVPKMVVQLGVSGISSIISCLGCLMAPCCMHGIASPHHITYGWNNIILSLACLPPGRAPRPMHIGQHRHTGNIWLRGLLQQGLEHCRGPFWWCRKHASILCPNPKECASVSNWSKTARTVLG